MVSWGDGEESSVDTDSSQGLNTVYDSDWESLADGEGAPVCKCGFLAAKLVAFEGCHTGRTFYGCSQPGESCDFVQWYDGEWPSSLHKAIGKIWDMYGETKDGRMNDALDWMDRKFEYQDEIAKLKEDLKIVQEEVNKTVKEKQVILSLKAKAEHALIDARAELEAKKKLDASASNLYKVMRIKAEKERDKFKEEKRKLEYIISDLLKQKEGTREKMRKIKDLCADV